MKLMYKTCIDLTHKHELKSENKNAPKAQIQNYKTALKLKQTTKSRNNQHHTDLLTFQDAHDFDKTELDSKIKMTQHKTICTD